MAMCDKLQFVAGPPSRCSIDKLKFVGHFIGGRPKVNVIQVSVLLVFALFTTQNDWPQWRGLNNDGMARGDAPHEWNDTKNIAWRVAIPGRGNSSPVIWGDKIFLTTAVPTDAATAAASPTPTSTPQGRRQGRGPGGGANAGREHKFVVMCLDRRTGKVLWERVAKVATPHEGYHHQYGSFASNTPVTDGKNVYAFFGSRGIYCYDLNGKLIWEKGFQPMRMRLGFGEGVATVLDGNSLYLKFDQEQGSHLLALDKQTGKEIWKVAREEGSSWSPPLIATHNGRKQMIVSASTKVRSYDPTTGKLIWECAGLGSNVIPAPVTHRLTYGGAYDLIELIDSPTHFSASSLTQPSTLFRRSAISGFNSCGSFVRAQDLTGAL
jgi:outer membrane protein assembly factor BamB